ncbi:leucine-rich repeat domain-containing protein [Prevotella sp.]|uniref:leucine-rich repeat domain-containing protein n=1 Tax=Prevotella sp. TaxID=59823 RepID=UPI003AF628F9
MHNIKQLYSIHFGRAVVYTLLSLFLFMAAGKVYAEERNPVVKIDKTSYTSSGTEVTLRLWMFNDSNPFTNYSARFTGEVNLYIDDQVVIKLNSIWSSIAGAKRETIFTAFTDKPVDINLDGTNVGTAQFNNLQYGQTCPDNSNTTDNSWYTVDLKLSFNKSFSYYGHKITVKGKWQDKSSGSVVEKDVALDNTINGFVRPVNLKAQPSGDKTMFTWEKQGYNSSASTDGKWIVYKREGDNNVKLGEVAANEQSLSVENVLFSCSNDYIVAFLPDACKGAETVCGLTTSIGGKAHQINADDICQICGHSFFRYHTSDGNKVDISGKDFGAKVVSHKVIDSECVIEFDAPITRIPKQAFNNCKNLTGNLVIPNSVTEIGDQAFAGCTGFTGDLTIPNSVTNIGISAFYNCTGFTGNLTIPNSVTTIGESAFYKCTGFTGKLTIPNSVTTIGKMAFYECSGFTGDLTIPNSVTTIETSTFEYCTGFKGKLTIPNSVTTIGEHAFNECSGFTGNLTIPNSVTTIGHLAFGACSGFTGDVSLPKSLEILGSTSFKACKKIKTIKFQSLPTVLKGSLDDYKAIVSLSDDSYISPEVSGTVNEISYTRQISNNWGTLVLPYPLKLTGSEPYRLYNIETVSDDELVLKQLDGEVASGTPCVVKRKGSEAELTFSANNAELNMAINDQPMDGMYFSGTYWTKDVNNGYIIAKDCFWNVAELNKSDLVKGVKVKPFRAWLDGTSPNGASQLSICVSDTATGIGAAGTIDVLNDTATEYYDLSGKRLDEPQRGVNIVRMKSGKTKKIIIK